MSQRRRHSPIELHLGAAAIGLILGLLGGFFAAIASAVFQVLTQVSFAGWVFGTGIATALACMAYPRLAFVLFPAAANFAAGYLAATTKPEHSAQIEPDRTNPPWVRIAFFVGVTAAVVAFFLGQVLG